jgi:hypothetical protein
LAIPKITAEFCGFFRGGGESPSIGLAIDFCLGELVKFATESAQGISDDFVAGRGAILAVKLV